MAEDIYEEVHPEWFRDLQPMYALILGSYPPHEGRRTYPFYYPNAQNRFWKILSDLAGIPLVYTKTDPQKAVEERYRIMQALHAGVHNLGKRILRRGKSSLDTNIEITEFQDILGIVRAHPELEKILLSGFSAPSSTARLFLRYLQEQGLEPDPLPQKIGRDTVFDIPVEGRQIRCIVLNSTSTASSVPYAEVLEQFRKALER